MKLTQEEKRIKIAEACRLFELYPLRYATRRGKLLSEGERGVRPMYCEHSKGGWQEWTNVPDYFNDLNAIHAAWEKVIKGSDELEDKYSIELLRAVGSDDPSDGVRPNGSDATWALASNATSSQRSRAFGLTLNLWSAEG